LFAPVQGATSVFIDGVFQVRHRYIDQGLPLQVTIPRSRLYENRELSIAVLVSPYPFYAKAKAAGSAFTEGFYTSIDADHFMRWTMFFGFSRHLITFIIFFLLARILWKTSNGQSNAYDYLAGAQFALVMAAISVASIDIMLRLMTVHTYYRLYFLLTLLEAIFLVRMAMSFLRATRSLSIPMGLMLFLGSVAVFGFAPPLWIESTGASLMASIVLPVTYGLCSLAVGYRGWQMLYSKRYQQGAASPERISFLLCAGYTLGLTALLYAWEAIRNAAPDVHWARTLNVMTIYLLVRLITKSRQVTVTAKETAAPVSIPVVAAAASEAKKAA
jgi:hypothetical protein